MLSLPRLLAHTLRFDAVPYRSLALLLVVALLSATTVPAFAKAPRISDPGVIKKKVQKLGVGEHVAVKRLADMTLHGHITAIGEQSFKLHADNTASETEIAYDQVSSVKKNPGPIGWMILGAVLLVVIVVAVKH